MRCKSTYGKTDDQEYSRAPGRARRKQIRRKPHPESTTQPSALFFAIKRVIEVQTATGEQGCTGIATMSGEKREHFPLALERSGAIGAAGKMRAKPGLFSRLEFAASCKKHHERLPLAADRARCVAARVVIRVVIRHMALSSPRAPLPKGVEACAQFSRGPEKRILCCLFRSAE